MSKSKKISQNPGINFLISIIIGISAFVLLLSICAFLLLKININSNYLFLFNFVVSAISVFIGAFVSAYKSKNKKLLKGLLTSLILIIIYFFLFLFMNKYIFTMNLLLIIPVCILTGFIGCVTGINIKRR